MAIPQIAGWRHVPYRALLATFLFGWLLIKFLGHTLYALGPTLWRLIFVSLLLILGFRISSFILIDKASHLLELGPFRRSHVSCITLCLLLRQCLTENCQHSIRLQLRRFLGPEDPLTGYDNPILKGFMLLLKALFLNEIGNSQLHLFHSGQQSRLGLLVGFFSFCFGLCLGRQLSRCFGFLVFSFWCW